MHKLVFGLMNEVVIILTKYMALSKTYHFFVNSHLNILYLFKKLHHALQLIVNKHQSLRTALIFNKDKNQLMQHVIDFNDHNNQLFSFIESTYETDQQLTHIMQDEKCNSQHFDLARGLVFRCHIVY